MNRYNCPTVTVRRRSILWMLVALLAATGCGMDKNRPPSTEALLSIENVAKWYQLYRAQNAGKPPADEDSFVAFINSTLTERGQEGVDRKELLTAPRDGAPYVVCYGKVNSQQQELNVVVYEQNGANGKKLIATELARSREVDESELQSLLSAK